MPNLVSIERTLGALLLTAGAVLAACTQENTRSSATRRASISFDVRGGDAFSWTKTVSGHSECGDVAVEVNDVAVDAPVDLDGSTFRARIPLGPGRNAVVARCRSDEATTDPSAPLVFDQRLHDRPTARITVSVQGDTVMLDAGASDATQPDGSRIVRYVWTPDARHPARLHTSSGEAFKEVTGSRLRLRAPAKDGEYYVSLEVVDATGRSDASTTYFGVSDGRARVVDLMREHPSWIDRAVIYAPIAQLWGNDGPNAIRRRLPYLKKLGIDALWLWPPATRRAFGEEYAITDYFELDPSWGPESAFKEMVDEAHRLGIRVLLDFVPNHMSSESPYFRDAQRHGKASNYWDFFDRQPNGKPTHYFDWTHLPNLNYDNHEVRNMIVEAFAHWVRDVGIDGFRVDAAWGVKRRRPDFWLEWRRELKRINPDLLLLAEAPAVDPYYFSHGFDVGYDWTYDVGQWAWTSVFDFPEESGALLAPALTNSGKGYARDAIVMRFLNNNDTGVRFVDQHGVEMTRVAATLQFTVPGIPAMFAGDEVGASYEPYSNLTPLAWRDRFGLRPFYDRLIDLKHRVPALSSRDIDVLSADTNSAVAYVRPQVGQSGPVLVILNFGSKTHVKISRDASLNNMLARSGGAMRDLITGDHVKLNAGADTASIAMDAQSYLVLVPETT